MNPLIAKLTGRTVQEDVPVPVASKTRPRLPRLPRHDVQRRTAAALMGMAESEDSIIPEDADEIEGASGSVDLGINQDLIASDKEPDAFAEPDDGGSDPDNQLIAPSAALVAPDITPGTLDPIDPSDVPAPAASKSSASINPLDVLLARQGNDKQTLPKEDISTAESVQASVNTVLGVNKSGDLIGRGKEMPAPTPADTRKVMEAFYKFAR